MAPARAVVPAGDLRSGVRLNAAWCAVLLVLGELGALGVAGSLGWQPGAALAASTAVIGVAVALLAGRSGIFEAAILPGTVVIVVGAVLIGVDPGALGGVAAVGGPARRVWDSIGLLAPAAATTWVCALATLLLRRLGLLRRL